MPTWAIAMISGVLPAIASGIVASWALLARARADLENQVQARLDESRRNFYSDFMRTFMMPVTAETRERERLLQSPKFVQQLRGLQPGIVMYASDQFVRVWNTVRSFPTESSDNVKRLALLALLLQAIRKDLGYARGKQDPVQTLAVFVNDLIGNAELEANIRQAASEIELHLKT